MQSLLSRTQLAGSCEASMLRMAMPVPRPHWRPPGECCIEQQHSLRAVATCAKRAAKSKTREPPAAAPLSEDAATPSEPAEPARKKRGRPKSVAKTEAPPEAPPAAAPAPAPVSTPSPVSISTEPHVGLIDIGSTSEMTTGAEMLQEELEQQLEVQYGNASPAPVVPGAMAPAAPKQASLRFMPAQAALQETEDVSGSYGVASGLPEDGYEKTALRQYLGYDMYRPLRPDAEELALLPRKVLPKTDSFREKATLQYNLVREYWAARRRHADSILMKGFEAHHLTRERGVNIYANTRRVAGLLSAFEDDDFKLQNLAPDNLAAWARAEMVFQYELDEFNEMLLKHADEIGATKLQEEEEEEADMIEEALFLSTPDDLMASNTRASQQNVDGVLQAEYLAELLPGAAIDDESSAFAEDIFSSERDTSSYYDDDVAAAKPDAGGVEADAA